MFNRLGPGAGEAVSLEPYVGQFDITRSRMNGWVMIEPECVADKNAVKGWGQRAVKFEGTLPGK